MDHLTSMPHVGDTVLLVLAGEFGKPWIREAIVTRAWSNGRYASVRTTDTNSIFTREYWKLLEAGK